MLSIRLSCSRILWSCALAAFLLNDMNNSLLTVAQRARSSALSVSTS
ncbi:hypothetical protein CH60_1352 [Yersinia pestis str. Pestoides B]|nr:hypothetical protein CH60_1352 [Yersinia pestis str. Pestoides B]